MMALTTLRPQTNKYRPPNKVPSYSQWADQYRRKTSANNYSDKEWDYPYFPDDPPDDPPPPPPDDPPDDPPLWPPQNGPGINENQYRSLLLKLTYPVLQKIFKNPYNAKLYGIPKLNIDIPNALDFYKKYMGNAQSANIKNLNISEPVIKNFIDMYNRNAKSADIKNLNIDPTGVKKFLDYYANRDQGYKAKKLDINDPNIQRYMAGGKAYKKAEQKLAPAFWQSYKQNVENPLINRFSASGTLGSPLAGLSGAAADALAEKRGDAQQQISSQVFQSVQQPLLEAFKQQGQIRTQEAMLPWQAQTGADVNQLESMRNYMQNMFGQQYQNEAKNAFTEAVMPWQSRTQESMNESNALRNMLTGLVGQAYGTRAQNLQNEAIMPWQLRSQDALQMAQNSRDVLQQLLSTQYGGLTQAAFTEAVKPWEALLEMRQYPYQILPGIVSGTLPPQVVDTGGGGGGKK